MAKLDNVKKRYWQTLNHPPRVTNYTSVSGMKVVIRDTGFADQEELDKMRDQEYRDAGFDPEKIRKAGVDWNELDPDSPEADRYRLDEYLY